MGYAENLGDYWRGRYKLANGKIESVRDSAGKPAHFRTKREAKRAADQAEATAAQRKTRTRTDAWRTTFGQYVGPWYDRQDLAASTMQNYRRHIENHLLPAFEGEALVDMTSANVDLWAKELREAGYAPASIKTWRSTLHLILSDAEAEDFIASNPATKRRGRGRRAGRSSNRGPEKAITDLLGIILIAERAALLSGRDDEFVAITLKGTTGMRFGEVIGLETRYVRPKAVRVEWQLYELDTGEFVRCPPKDDSHRTVDLPGFMSDLLSQHIKQTKPVPCPCHGYTYVFSGHRPANGAARAPGAKLVDVARLASVSTGTVSNVLNRPDTVPEKTRTKVTAAAIELGYVRGGPPPGTTSAHWRRTGFSTWVFRPAATGWYPRVSPRPPRPVPVTGGPWPGVPVRGRAAAARAEACWLPVAPDLTPHGLRHSHRTLLVELGIPPVLIDNRMGHDDGSVQARYTHITADMRRGLQEALTARWEAALRARKALAESSPVQALDRLLQAL